MRYVILDSNIFQYASNSLLVEQIRANLQEAVSAGYGIAYCQFSIFELLNESTPNIEQERITAMGKMKNFRTNKKNPHYSRTSWLFV